MLNTTADLYDRHPEQVQVATSGFCDYGGVYAFWGTIATVQCFEDNSLVRSSLEQPGQKRVLVVDGGRSVRCALLGDQLARIAHTNGWSGLIINGCIRDSEIIKTIDIGIKAVGTCPAKSEKKNLGQTELTLHFAGLRFIPGHYVYADLDGVLVAECALHQADTKAQQSL